MRKKIGISRRAFLALPLGVAACDWPGGDKEGHCHDMPLTLSPYGQYYYWSRIGPYYQSISQGSIEQGLFTMADVEDRLAAVLPEAVKELARKTGWDEKVVAQSSRTIPYCLVDNCVFLAGHGGYKQTAAGWHDPG